jgi:hypothetical protein
MTTCSLNEQDDRVVPQTSKSSQLSGFAAGFLQSPSDPVKSAHSSAEAEGLEIAFGMNLWDRGNKV